MRWYVASLILVLCAVVLATGLQAQTVFEDQSIETGALINDENKVFATDATDATESTAPRGSSAEVRLNARPISCATLRQSQPCFVKFSMTWESDRPISACLISEQSDASACWEEKMSGEFRKDLYLSETTMWDLLNDQGESLGQIKVSVAWVYKSSRVRRNWRLF